MILVFIVWAILPDCFSENLFQFGLGPLFERGTFLCPAPRGNLSVVDLLAGFCSHDYSVLLFGIECSGHSLIP